MIDEAETTTELKEAVLECVPAPYLIVYRQGNGERCHCHRQSWNVFDTREFYTHEAAAEWAIAYNKEQENKDSDRKVECIYPLVSDQTVYNS